MFENIFSNEEQIESGESRNLEKQELDDATFEPRAHVEQSGDFQQAEAIQDAISNLADGTEMANVPVEPLNPVGDVENLPLPCCPPGDLPEGSGKLDEGGNTYAPNPGIPKDGSGWLPETNENGEFQKVNEITNQTAAHEIVDTSQLEYEPGPVQQPPDWDHGPPKDQVNLEDEDSVLGRMPKVREDLSELEPVASDDDEDDGKDNSTMAVDDRVNQGGE